MIVVSDHSIRCSRNLFTIKIMVAIIMPDDVAEEKVKALKALGADVERVRPASIVDKKQVRTLVLFNVDLVTHFSPTSSML